MTGRTIRERHLALARECERLARLAEAKMNDPSLSDGEKLGHVENSRIYWQMAQSWTEGAMYAEQARPVTFTGRAKGLRESTKEKQAFLGLISAEIGTRKHAAVAAEAVSSHKGLVRSLWRAEGANAESKILNFLRNNGF